VVEFEHNDVCLATIDARMTLKVAIEFPPVSIQLALHLRDRPPDVIGPVLQVMSTAQCCMADSAVTLP